MARLQIFESYGHLRLTGNAVGPAVPFPEFYSKLIVGTPTPTEARIDVGEGYTVVVRGTDLSFNGQQPTGGTVTSLDLVNNATGATAATLDQFSRTNGELFQPFFGSTTTITLSASTLSSFVLNGADMIFGGPGVDSISADRGDDTLSGGGGDDTLSGGDNADTLFGETGDDRLNPDSNIAFTANNVVDGGAGFDIAELRYVRLIETSFTFDLSGATTSSGATFNTTLIRNVEAVDLTFDGVNSGYSLTLTSGSDRLRVGQSGDGTIRSGSGADTIDGIATIDPKLSIDAGAGDDRIAAGFSSKNSSAPDRQDTVDGGTGYDVLVFADALGGSIGVNQTSFDFSALGFSGPEVVAKTRFGLSTTALISNIEGIFAPGSSTNGFPDFMVGGRLDDTFVGGLGSDTLRGGGGDDLIAPHGAVSLGGDLSEFSAPTGNIDSVDGGAGFDRLDIGFGIVTSLIVTVDLSSLDGGAPATLTFAGTNYQILARNFESVGVMIDTDARTNVTGTREADVLIGAQHADTLTGGLGSDVIVGGAGTDVWRDAGRAQAAFAVVDLGTEVRLIHRADGETDRVREVETFEFSSGSVALAALVPARPAAGAAGTAVGDVINGSEAGESTVSDIGDDIVLAVGGDDRIDAGYGYDYVSGGAGADTILGGGTNVRSDFGYDILFGDDGNDVIAQNAGRVYAVGGAGSDVISIGDGPNDFSSFDYVFGDFGVAGGGAGDLITKNGTGRLYVSGGDGADTIRGGDEHRAAAGEVIEYLFGDGGADLILGGAGEDALVGSNYSDANPDPAGDPVDTLNGGWGDDYVLQGTWGRGVLTGGEGNDTIVGAAGADVISMGRGEDYAYGYGGGDVFIVEAADMEVSGLDRIVDFYVAGSTLRFIGVAASTVTFGQVGDFASAVVSLAGGEVHTILAGYVSAGQLQAQTTFI